MDESLATDQFGAIYVSVPALFIVYLPPLALALTTLVYAGISLRWFIHRRAQFQEILRSSQSGLTTGRYLRLIALSITAMLMVTSMAIFMTVKTIELYGLAPWVCWEFVHDDWLRVDQIAKVLAPQGFWDNYLLGWHVVPVASAIFFPFFGFGQEATAQYKEYVKFVKTKIFRIKPKPQLPVLPVSARGGLSTIDSKISTPAAMQLHIDTMVSRTSEKLDEPSSFVHTTSRPPYPSIHSHKTKDTLDIEETRL